MSGREWEQPQSDEQGEMRVNVLGDLGAGGEETSCEEQPNVCLAGSTMHKKDVWEKAVRGGCCHGGRGRSWRALIIGLIKEQISFLF